ncbi:MAG TPA: thioredoxin [Dysgonomonas sp.]|uniref:thioredoxin n=1 Tax=unclassified Dysgonomonas TaxID=2630389 RepID=UPI0025C15866|nr:MULTISPECIES: thioredoxin [unclassified Dysgonomonas]HML66210.1 thioredoxin [Dysgonomonas sp.]
MRRKITLPILGIVLMTLTVLLGNNSVFGNNNTTNNDTPIVTLTSSNYEKETGTGLVFVDFWAPWCGPCRRMAPILESVAKEYKGSAKIGKINVDNYKKFSIDKGIEVLPTIVVYKDGKEITRLRGLVSKEDLVKIIAEHTKK